ncbi:MAG: DNA polymerase Y family protein, partial [Pseudomonadota bacterium]
RHLERLPNGTRYPEICRRLNTVCDSVYQQSGRRAELIVNVTGVGHLFSGEQDLMADAIARLQRAGFGARAAIADTPGAAHALARYATNPDRPTALAAPCETAGALAPLPIEALRLEADCVLLLKRLGLHRIGQLLALPRAALARRFRDAPRGSAKARKSARDDLARAVVWRLDQALGHVREPKAPIVPPPRFIARQTFTEPLISSDGIMQASAALAGDLCSALSEASDGALGLRLSLFRADGTTAHVEIGASRPTADPEHMVGLLREPLEAVDAGLGIDLMTLDALRTAPMIAGQCALSAGDGGPAGDATARLVDRLSNRLGAGAVARFDARNTHLPERAEGHRPAVTAAKPAGAQSQSPQALLDVPLPDQALRPAFLLPAPEPITVIAELPEGPPARFQWRRLSCRIHRAIGPERITPEWWRALEAYRDSEAARAAEEADADTASAGKDPGGAAETEPVCATTGLPGRVVTKSAVPRVRDYYVLEADHGGRYWAFRDGLYQREAEDGAPQWYMQGVFG